ncbi:MAG: hypothetical protein O9325_16875 [Roseomonas sp.]|nr:hypothetical protein [Roseomonas sp.]
MDNAHRINEGHRLGALQDPQDPSKPVVERVRNPPISMLAPQTLTAMHLFAREAPGVVLELGAYVGGGTLVLLDGARTGGRRVITIEEPVSHPTHPHIPTENSVRDLRANLSRFAEASHHSLLEGASFEQWLLGSLLIRLMGEPIGFLAWDADTMFDRDLALLAPLLAPDCLLMADDYDADNPKSAPISRRVDALVTEGLVETIAVLPWGSWFGQLRRKPTAAELRRWQEDWRRESAAGDLYAERFLDYWDRMSGADVLPVITFEERGVFWRRAAEKALGR